MATADERKLELERKKQRLAEIREEKKKREDEKRRKLLEHKPGAAGEPSTMPTQEEVERILQDVGISPQAEPLEAGNSLGADGTPVKARDRTASPAARSLFTGSARVQHLSKAETTQVNFAPRDNVSYSKTTQTDVETAGREFVQGSLELWEDDMETAMGGDGGLVGDEVFNFDESPTHQLAGLLPHITPFKPAEVASSDQQKGEDRKKQLPDLSEEEKAQIIGTRDFQTFFDRASRVIERALTEQVDIFVDYSRDGTDKDRMDTGLKLSLSRTFFDEKWSTGRCVTGLDFCVQHPELIATAYNNNESAPNEPDGVVLIWNSKFKKTTPEYIFHSQSRITSVAFAKFHPNLVMGGSYSGQICMWDNRLNKKTPVNKSPLSTTAHTHPIYSLTVVGTQNAHNLISVSTDGRLCSWSIDNLNQPQEAIDLTWKGSKQVASTCLSFPLNDVNNFVVGGEEGTVYTGCRHGSKAGVVEAYDGHYAPISGVDCHQAVGPVDFSQLFLTSSFDWTVKLWSTKEAKPLCSFENHNDYVLDVAWSPAHPALFACVDGQGKLDVWNMNEDAESPAASLVVEGSPALNKVMWMANGILYSVCKVVLKEYPLS
uniref:Cytoplasmic dynein 1 intermediate chain 2 n=1 Tax=Plectus sambesii TaxID=2011161 RepID=A0A914XDU8_9BILA